MSRFEPGKKYLFMRHQFVSLDKNGKPNGTLFYTSMLDQPLISTEFVVLTCKEEHEVPIDYSNTKSTGYTFSNEEENVIFNNQYPSASYGQLSTAGDYIVKALVTDDSGERSLLKYVLAENVLNDISMFAAPHGLTETLEQVVNEIKQAVDVNGFKFEEDELSKLFKDKNKELLKIVEA
ncbi:hypothetical protein [Vibrio parahaemolyticus]|uniref:hypothetical protein n=1 Tax=Vibrio parahaemolyticus TaxID=670 RepID=UPI00226A174C|nr:hypothetical protein [Vibrio parahaemolyticus]MCX8795898.1 hypothetical protein [Vibrio parahaemolyticus]